MAKINAINNKSAELTIDPGASGDSFVQFDINGTGEFRLGVDDDASDAFKIAQGSSLGTNDTFTMTANGERTMSSQPAFLAYLGSTQSNTTGNGSATIQYDTEIFDQNNDFNTGTYTFTAPITGKYIFYIGSTLSGVVAASRNFIVITTSNRDYSFDSKNVSSILSASGNHGSNGVIHADMDASDTASVVTVCTGEASNIVDIDGGSSPIVTFFGGHLAC